MTCQLSVNIAKSTCFLVKASTNAHWQGALPPLAMYLDALEHSVTESNQNHDKRMPVQKCIWLCNFWSRDNRIPGRGIVSRFTVKCITSSIWCIEVRDPDLYMVSFKYIIVGEQAVTTRTTHPDNHRCRTDIM